MSRQAYEDGQKYLRSKTTVVTVTTAGNLIIGAAPGRVGVRFSAPPANRVTILEGRQPTLDNGWNAYPATARGPEFCAAVQGTITELPFYGITVTADQAIAVTETFLLPGA